ncbi:MAG TPA: sigma-70 family RNA polymerase sigma factor, partial [Stellaceae bacterium]|nr:sigma-70 family RNA polymerase sigma factor [Stellaceae bacterium]
MAFTAALESSAQLRQAKSTVDSFAPEIVALLPVLRRYARHLTHNAAAADDLVQETVFRGIENIHLWRQGTDLRAWLFTILHNLHISDMRRAVRYSTLVRSTHAELSSGCPPRQIEWLMLRDLERALARLPEEQRSVVVLVGLKGERYETVAARLGIPAGTVRSRLSRGRRRLRELMDGRPPPDVASGLIRRDRRSRAGRTGRVGD